MQFWAVFLSNFSSCLRSVRPRLSACCWSSTVSPSEWSGGVSTRALNTALSGYPFPLAVHATDIVIDCHHVLLIELDNSLTLSSCHS